MDEPLSNLDALLRMDMRSELKSLLKESKTTTLYVTHDQTEAMSLADRIAVMKQGELIQYEKPMTLYQYPENQFVGGFLGSPPMNFFFVETKKEQNQTFACLDSARFSLDSSLDLSDHSLLNNSSLIMGIRAEDLELEKTNSSTHDSFLAEVLVIEPLGAQQQVTLKVGTQNFRAIFSIDLELKTHSFVRMRPKASKILWFHPESQQYLAKSNSTTKS